MPPTDATCTRCGKPIERDGQTCVFKGQRWPCRPPGDPTVIEVDGLLIRTGDAYGNYGTPLRYLDDPYAE